MTAEEKLSTVALDERGQKAREQANSDRESGAAVFATAGAVVFASLVYLKDMLYPSFEAPDSGQEPSSARLAPIRTEQQPGDDTAPAQEAASQQPQEDADAEPVSSGRAVPPSGRIPAIKPLAVIKPIVASIEFHRDQPPKPSNDTAPFDLDVAMARISRGGLEGSQAFSYPQMMVGDTVPPSDADANTDHKATEGRRTNHAPVVSGQVRIGDILSNSSILISMASLLAYARDPDGDTIMVKNLAASSGGLTDNGNGTWRYTPAESDDRDVTFRYQVTDGLADTDAIATASLIYEQPVILGTSEADTLAGSDLSDVIDARAGDDIVCGNSGDDTINGGEGDDVLFGGDGNDTINGGGGNDIIFAGAGDDIVHGGDGDDSIDGGDGNDTLFGEAGNDVIQAGAGDDRIDAGAGDDIVFGDAGNDTIRGGDGNDILDGGQGDDALTGGAGQDIVRGGEGNDSFVAAPGDGDDAYDGGSGTDTYDASAAQHTVIIDLAAGTATGADIGHDTITGIENAVGGAGDDMIVSSAAANVMTGGAGNDTFVFTDHDDQYDVDDGDSREPDGHFDEILDFTVGDRIDLSRMDGDEDEDGRQEFEFRGEDAFSRAGQVRYGHEHRDDGDHTLVYGNNNDDIDVDFMLDLYGFHELTRDDFHGVY